MAPELFLVGGHEDRSPTSLIHQEFVRLAGGARARILVCTAGTELAAEYGDVFVDLLRALGAGAVSRLDIASSEQASAVDVIEAIGSATAVFFTGGDQRRIMRVLGKSAAGEALRRRAAAGLLVGGTSAGAAVAGSWMISGTANPVTEPGMGFWAGVLVDQHFSQRGRLSRLLQAVAARPGASGVGIDENTALLVSGARIRVIGAGRVTLIAGDATVSVLDAGMSAPNPAIGGSGLT